MTQEDKDFKRFVETGMMANWNKFHEIEPVAFVVSKTNQLGIMNISELMRSQETKSLVSVAIKKITKEIQSVRAAMVSEAWLAVSDGDNNKLKEEFKQAGSVKDMPSKQEAVFVTIWTKQETIMNIWIIDRVKNELKPIGEQKITPINQEVNSIFQNPFKPDPNVN